MAASSCSPVTCVGTLSDAFYFKVGAAGTDVVDDSFNISKHSLPCCWVQSKDNKFLLLNDEHQFQVQNLTSEQLNQPECKFKIQIYSDFERGGEEEKRNAAMLYVRNEGKNVVACCSQENAVHAEEMEVLPVHIEETHHKALFYMTELTPSHTYEFESSAFPSRFLGFEPDGRDPSLVKLVLHQRAKDEVDESCHVILCR